MQGEFIVPAGHCQARNLIASSFMRSNQLISLCSIAPLQQQLKGRVANETWHSTACAGPPGGSWTLQGGWKKLLQQKQVLPAKGYRLAALATRSPPGTRTATPLQAFLAFLIANGASESARFLAGRVTYFALYNFIEIPVIPTHEICITLY
jgi:hypothetical protein